MTSLRLSSRGLNMQEEQHRITNSYLWPRVQFVGLNVVWDISKLCAVSNMGAGPSGRAV